MIVSPRFFWLGISLGVIGCLFYANFREPLILFDNLSLFQLFSFVEQPILLPNAISEWIPSFLHIIGMSFFTAGIIRLNKDNYWKVPIIWLGIDILFEGLQSFQTSNVLTWGNFEWVDIIAMTLSAIITLLIFKHVYQDKNTSQSLLSSMLSFSKSVASLTAFSVGSFMMLGSYQANQCVFPNGTMGTTIESCEVEAIILSWDKIRNSGTLLSKEYGEGYQQPLRNANKIYTYQDLLLINEERTGVHIFNNENPEAPEYLDFILLIGNQDMAIKDEYLYLDSFTDLVIYDLTKPTENPIRKNNVFSLPDPATALPFNVSFIREPNTNEGIVIGYQNSQAEKFYFWSYFAGLEE